MTGIKKASCFRKVKALAAVPMMQIRQDANLSLVLMSPDFSNTFAHLEEALQGKKKTICNSYVALDQQLAHPGYR